MGLRCCLLLLYLFVTCLSVVSATFAVCGCVWLVFACCFAVAGYLCCSVQLVGVAI